MSNAQRKEWFGEGGKFDSAEIRRNLAGKQSPAAPPETRHTTPAKTLGIKFPDLAAKKGTAPVNALNSHFRRRLERLEKITFPEL